MLVSADTLENLPYGICCYLVRRRDHSPDSVLATLIGQGLSNAWITAAPTELRGEEWMAVSIQLLKDAASEGGWPVASDEVGQALSGRTDVVLELLVTPGAETMRLGLFGDGERQREPLEQALPASEDPCLTELEPAALLELAAVQSIGEMTCGEHTHVLSSQRTMEVPPWADKSVDLFRFTERTSAGIGEAHDEEGQRQDEDDRGRVSMVALDLTRLRETLNRRSVAGVLQGLDFYANRDSKRFLGPLQGELPRCQEILRQMPGGSSVREAPELVDLAELLAMAHTRVSAPGNRVAYLDEVFFPLLNLASETIPETLDEDELDELDELDLIAAMADQLPYHAPEGELLESFADEEVVPLAQALELGGGAGEGGALWLLDHHRLRQRLDALDPEAFAHCCEEFMKAWWLTGQGSWELDQRQWLEQRVEHDETAIRTFFSTWSELRTLVTMADLNELKVALLFYE